MFMNVLILLPLLAMLSAVNATLAGDFVLVSNGQSRAQIVLAGDQTAPAVQFAAQELQRYIKTISGALVPLVQEATSQPAIVLSCEKQRLTVNPREQLS